MHLSAVFLLCGLQIVTIRGQLQVGNQFQFQSGPSVFSPGFPNNGLNGGLILQPLASQESVFQNQAFSQLGNSAGNAAAAGNAGAGGLGSASSINQAEHQADQFNTHSSGLSANIAQGQGPQAGGAAQAGGSIQNFQQLQNSIAMQSALQTGRRKRQVNGFNGFAFPQSLANANSLGGGSALLGRVATRNNAFSQTSPFAGLGFAAGDSIGEGQGVNIFQAANTNSQSGLFNGRLKRQIGNFAFNGFPQSLANANALGGGSALHGRVATRNNAFSQTSPFAGLGFAAGDSIGEGQGVNIFQAANTNSQSGFFNGRLKRQVNFNGFNFPSRSVAGANALGGGSANFGRVATNNNAFSQTNPWGATGFAAGNSFGQGQGVNIFDAVNTNAASGIFGS